jgi:DNA polymerase I
METMITSPIILVDGSSYLYRAYHGLPPLTTSKGQTTHAIRGVLSMLKKLLKDYQPSHMAVVMDSKGKTFRHGLYREYKAHRPAMPEDLASQIPLLKEAIIHMGLPLIEMAGVEADDVIGSLAKEITQAGKWQCLISTGDKDLAQLVTSSVSLINTMDQLYLDEAGVYKKFEVTPQQMIDLLALQGDKSDNIPGLPGVGEKTAKALIFAFGSVENIYKNLSEIPQLKIRGAAQLKNKLTEHRELVDLSYQLATIRTDLVADSFDIHELKIKDSENIELLALYEQLEFKNWAQEIKEFSKKNHATEPSRSIHTEQQTQQAKKMEQYETIRSLEALEAWIKEIEAQGLVAVDTETTGLDYMNAELVGIALAVKEKACYIPLQHTEELSLAPSAADLASPDQLVSDQTLSKVLVANQLPLTVVLQKLTPIFTNENIRKIGQNIKYDQQIFARYQLELKGICEDTMLESYILDSVGSRHDLDTLSRRYLSHETITFESLAGKGVKQKLFSEIDIESAARYAAEDADITYQLHTILSQKLKAIPSILNVYENIERPLVPILAKIERTGALIDTQRLQKHSEKLQIAIDALNEKIKLAAGTEFNAASPKQLGQILYEQLQLPVIRKTPTGAPSTAEDVLEELASYHELPKLIVEQRGLSKLKNTYTDKLPTLVDAITQRIHTSYHQAVTITGRLSSSDPNLQNIPVKNEQGRDIRKAFIAPEHCYILSLDYSQIELRIMAHLSKDEHLIAAFLQGLDIHKATASEVFSTPLKEVTHEMRRQAKAINFGLIYGMSAFGLSKQLGIGRFESQAFIDTIRQQAHEKEFVETLSGRRLYLPEINSRNKLKQMAAERTAINAPLQGTAADIIKIAMIEVDRWLEASQLKTKLIMQVHDELVFEVPALEATQVQAEIKEIMEKSYTLSVPLVVDAGIGKNWDEAH